MIKCCKLESQSTNNHIIGHEMEAIFESNKLFLSYIKILENKLILKTKLYEIILMALEAEKLLLTAWFTFLKGFLELFRNTEVGVVDTFLYFVISSDSSLSSSFSSFFFRLSSFVVNRNLSLRLL